jgi:uncharacterized protein (DUF1697 family)
LARVAAFLRGINLGGRRVRNDALARAFEDFGLESVATFLASGNVVFAEPDSEPRALEVALQPHLERALDFPVLVFLRPVSRLEALTRTEPVIGAEEAGFTPHVAFLRREPGEDVRRALAALDSPGDRFHVTGREVIWLRRGRMSDSPIKTRHLERALGGPEHTLRNLNTVRRMAAKFGSEEAV